MESRFSRDTWSLVDDCWIKNCSDRLTQSINVSRSKNHEGDYEEKFYFRGQWRVTDGDIRRFKRLKDLSALLRRRDYKQKNQKKYSHASVETSLHATYDVQACFTISTNSKQDQESRRHYKND